MLTSQFKKILKEFGSLYQVGHYPTSDEAQSIPTVSKTNEWGCMLELADGVTVECSVTNFNENLTYGAFHKDGSDAEVFELSGKDQKKFFNKFKKQIEEKFDQKLLDEKEAKERFNSYLEKVFI